MKTRTFQSGVVHNTCGLAVLSVFRPANVHGGLYGTLTAKIIPMDGTGFVVAGFTNKNKAYQAAYEELKARWKIEYQSPVRRNTRTGHQFFFCIYDSRSKP